MTLLCEFTLFDGTAYQLPGILLYIRNDWWLRFLCQDLSDMGSILTEMSLSLPLPTCEQIKVSSSLAQFIRELKALHLAPGRTIYTISTSHEIIQPRCDYFAKAILYMINNDNYIK